MKLWNRLAGISIAIVAFSVTIVSAQEPTAGVVRISDLEVSGSQMKQQSYSVYNDTCTTQCDSCQGNACQSCNRCEPQNECGPCGTFCGLFRKNYRLICCPLCEDDCNDSDCRPVRYSNCPDDCSDKKRCRHCQTAPFGCYKIAYPVNPQHFDGRDGAMYSAQGYGVNVSVPLAPNVGAAYNYGWGIPSSRLTPIANRLPVPAMPINRR